MKLLNEYLIYLIPVMGILGLIVMAVKSSWVNKQDTGDASMAQLAKYIADGSMAFLKAEWKVMTYFVVIAALLLAYSGTLVEHSSPIIAIAFIIGAFLSALAGYIGMRVATKANVRTTQAARTSLAKALKVSFTGGSVLGLGVAGLAVLGMGALFIVFYNIFVPAGAVMTGSEMKTAIEVLAGFSLGAESIALFARVGGGIYTKAADVGADLVGKVEAGIPEDDPRNPATIADNVGDNVGDVAGMGADLFGSYVATIVATMVLGQEITSVDNFGGMAPILLPMVIAGLGLIFSIIAMSLVRITNEESSVQAALNRGNWVSIILVVLVSYPLTQWMLPESLSLRGHAFSNTGVFLAIIVGSVVGALMGWITEYYTSTGKRPVNNIIKQSSTGHATNIIAGLALGMQSTVVPILILATGIIVSFSFAGLYGVAIAAAGMMATTAMQLAIDGFGPIADNAGGIAEMSGLPDEVRERTDNLDSVGNTTAATGKGFAIASAALTALALFAAFVGVAGIEAIDIYKAPVLAMLFVGGMIPFIFSSLTISAVGRAAMEMVHEVRRQFREIPGIMEGTATPEYEKCIEISTKASIREMILPGAIALLAPVIIGFGFKGVFADTSSAEMLGGLLAGITVTGVLMGIFQNNAGGAWDNAKKSIEAGVTIDGDDHGKGSEIHKASVTGDTVGDPFKDTSGPSMNILIKLTSIVALIIAPHIAVNSGDGGNDFGNRTEIKNLERTVIDGEFEVNPRNSTFNWVGKKVTGQHHGTVDGFGKLAIKENIVVDGRFEMDMNSIKVLDLKDPENNAKLSEHLRSADFFGVDKFRHALLSIEGAYQDGKSYIFKGEIVIKDNIRGIEGVYDVVLKEGRPLIVGAFSFDRTEFDIRFRSGKFFDDLGDKMISDDVMIGFEINL